MNADLVSYIKAQFADGISADIVRAVLAGMGWDREVVEQAIREAGKPAIIHRPHTRRMKINFPSIPHKPIILTVIVSFLGMMFTIKILDMIFGPAIRGYDMCYRVMGEASRARLERLRDVSDPEERKRVYCEESPIELSALLDCVHSVQTMYPYAKGLAGVVTLHSRKVTSLVDLNNSSCPDNPVVIQ